MRTLKRVGILTVTVMTVAAVLAYSTVSELKNVPSSFRALLSDSHHVQILDRNGEALNRTYQNSWNVHDVVALHQVPEFLRKAFVFSEDKRFYRHAGPDWMARSSAVVANLKAMRSVRGASTITEQTVRMINPRPRTVWSRWLEGFEAGMLEEHFSKDEILEFYLNQVPYAANRRGVVQAARYYFNRDLDTLSRKEMLALAVLVRAPGRLDLWKDSHRIEASIARLAGRLVQEELLSINEKENLLVQDLELQEHRLQVNATEFVRHVKRHPLLESAGWPHVRTTLDAMLQQRIQTMLDTRLSNLAAKSVSNGAVLAVDHSTGEILAWAVAGKGADDTPGRFIDAVTAPRQPGSALKPMLYSLALEKGWTAATVIDDSPLSESVGHGLHSYNNYSRSFYGPVTLRQALGNSLNIPALKTLQYVGAKEYLNYLGKLGFEGLYKHPDYYGDGIALGNGEVTLYELVQAFTAMASQGVLRPLKIFSDGLDTQPPQRVLSAQVASLLGNILSDPKARQLEFGENSILNFPVQTAVKTGTSSDYRDSWAVGFNYRYTVGVWMGNLDQRPMEGVTGSVGPALLLRSVFSELTRHQKTEPLPLHRGLVRQDICGDTGEPGVTGRQCKSYTEWFVPGTEPEAGSEIAETKLPIRLRRPTNGLHMAYDPRLPEESQAFEFFIQGVSPDATVEWNINGEEVVTQGGQYLWSLQKGKHTVKATVSKGGRLIASIPEAGFLVK